MASIVKLEQADVRSYVRHFVEMVVAMLLGMVILGVLVWAVFDVLGHANLRHYAGVRSLVMTTNMAIGMALWMRHRKHSGLAIGEMAAAMYLPYALLIGPFLAGLISPGLLLGAMHVLMFPAMIVAMFLRRDEYVHNGQVAP